MKRRKHSLAQKGLSVFREKTFVAGCFLVLKMFFPKKLRFGHYLMVVLVGVVIAANVFMLLKSKNSFGADLPAHAKRLVRQRAADT